MGIGAPAMGLAQSALILLGIGIVSSRFKAGVGLGELGTGIQTLVAAPLTGTGTGLSAFSGGLRDLAETLGDLGRGFGTLFENIPKLPQLPAGPPGSGGGAFPSPGTGNGNGIVPPGFPGGGGGGVRTLIPDSGGSQNTLLAGGGGAVTDNRYVQPAPILETRVPQPSDIRLRPTQIYTRNRDIVML